jgi:hypothetical protein
MSPLALRSTNVPPVAAVALSIVLNVLLPFPTSIFPLAQLLAPVPPLLTGRIKDASKSDRVTLPSVTYI